MANFLKTVLDLQEPIFSAGVTQLEKSTGHSGVDVRLIADITRKAHIIMRALGLDPSDTTGHELYFALNVAARRTDIEMLLADSDYVLYILNGKVMSFNLIDIIENRHHELQYDRQIISHGQRSLRGELVERYISHARTDAATVQAVASHIGLLPETDKWYTKHKDKH
jgi:hypothetical protein